MNRNRNSYIVKNIFNKNYDLRAILSLGLVMIGYCISIVAYGLNGRTILDADEAAEMVLASHLNNTHRFFSSDWYYSTELRVLNTQFVNKLSLALSPHNWHVARTISIAILMLFLVLTYLYLVRAAHLGWVGVLTCLALVVPFSTQYSYVVLYGSFYVPHIAIIFLLLAFTIRTLSADTRGIRIFFLMAANLLSLTAGLGGVRQFLVYHAPIFVTAFLLILLNNHSQASIRTIMRSQSGRLFIVASSECLSCIIGVAINSTFFHKLFTFEKYTNVSLNSISLHGFWEYFDSIFNLWGYEGCAELKDITGAAALCGLSLCAMFFLFVIISIRQLHDLSFTDNIFVIMFVVSVLINTLFYLLANNPLPRFLMPAAILILPIIPIVLNQKRIFSSIWKALFLMIFVICLLIQSVNYNWYYSFRDRGQKLTAEEEVTKWLIENGHNKGYATFWNGDNITELSNGDIEVWVIATDSIHSDWSDCDINEWLQIKSHKDKLADGPVFLLLDSEEIEEAGELPFEDHLEYEQRGYAVYLFESTDDLFCTHTQ